MSNDSTAITASCVAAVVRSGDSMAVIPSLRIIKLWLAGSVVLSALTSCTSVQLEIPPLFKLPALYTPNGLLEPTLALTQIPDYDLLGLTPDVTDYVDRYVSASMPPEHRARILHSVLRNPAFMGIKYYRDHTVPALKVVELKSANCISYANLYIALARHYGLKAGYQVIEKYPEWNRQGSVISMDIHINSLVRVNHGTQLRVDMTSSGSRQTGRANKVSDNTAKGLFYSNLAIDALAENKLVEAYSFSLRSLELAPEEAMHWSNLGAIYRRNNQFEAAENAYLQALTIDPNAYAAINNLAALYEKTGAIEKYAKYYRRLDNLREQNPYYHYYLAQQAKENNNLKKAYSAIRRAIAIKDDEPEFEAFLSSLSLKTAEAVDSDYEPS